MQKKKARSTTGKFAWKKPLIATEAQRRAKQVKEKGKEAGLRVKTSAFKLKEDWNSERGLSLGQSGSTLKSGLTRKPTRRTARKVERFNAKATSGIRRGLRIIFG